MFGISVAVFFALAFFTSSGQVDGVDNNSAVGGVGEIAEVDLDEDFLKKIEETERKKNELLGISEESEKSEDAIADEEPAKVIKKIKYRVRRNESLSTIASKFNVSVASIAGSSGIKVIDEVSVGQVVYVPSQEGFFYNVRRGNRLADILKKYKVPLEKFVAANPDINPDLLEAGEEIFLPGAKPKNLIRGWLVPVNSRYITSGYGWRNFPRRSFHRGLDLKAPYTSVRSAKRGVVTYAGWLGGYGRVVVIKHSGGYKTLYAHLSRIYTKKGRRVNRGTLIGRSGNTGYSFGPHLHFEVTKNGKNINPLRILKGLRGRR